MAGTTQPPDYRERTVPPATPPVVAGGADAEDAATLPHENGDSDFPGRSPAEIQPQQEPAHNPGQTPDELVPDQGDTDQPDSSPSEAPELPQTPAAPD
jgi:hypothetical protein